MQQARCLHTEQVFDGRMLDVRVDRVRLPNGSEGDLEVVHHPGAAAVVAIDAEEHVLLVRQYRYATGQWITEVPAGKLDASETPEQCARRELEEEVGVRARTWTSMGSIWTTPGFTNERIWLFLASDLEDGRQKLDPDEVLSTIRWPLPRALEQAVHGDLLDAKTVCALLRVPAHRQHHQDASRSRGRP